MNRVQSSVKTFKDLQVWQKAHIITLEIYRATITFPKEELYGITSQIRRAAVSTAANIVEGSKRRSSKDFAHFLNIAQGSNEEVKYYLLLSSDLKFLTPELSNKIFNLTDELGAMLHVFISKLISVH